MLLTSSPLPAAELPHRAGMGNSREAPLQQQLEHLAASLAKQPSARCLEHESNRATCASAIEHRIELGAEQVPKEQQLAEVVKEASKLQPGQREKAVLMRTSSVPEELLTLPETIGVQTSGLEWSGSIEGPTLIKITQDLGQQGVAEGSEENTGTISFPPREQYRSSTLNTMSRVSEDFGRSGTLSESICASIYGADRTASSTIGLEDFLPTVSKHSSVNTPAAEPPFESPFEAPQFQEDPIARPASLPEITPDDIARSAATVPPSQLDSLLSPSATDYQSQPLNSREDSSNDLASESSVEQQQLNAHAMGVYTRQTGMKSMSAFGGRVEEIKLLTALRQNLAQEAGFEPPSHPRPTAAKTAGQGMISMRSQTVPSADLVRALEALNKKVGQPTGLMTIPSGAPLPLVHVAEEEDMSTTTALQQDISKFQPAEDLARSPTRSPSLFDLAAQHSLQESDEWVIKGDELELGRRIGAGSYGEVFRGQWRHTDVAVKRITNVTEALVEDFRQEVALMAKLKHPNIVQFLGACMEYPNLSIVTQFMPRGSLFNLLHKAKVPLDDRQKLWMALDCARGMHYLHSCRPPIVHGDLNSKNLLVDRDFSIKVADFGMSRQRLKAMLSAKEQGGTAEWTAPEVLRGLPYNEKSDVYSFGVVFWELMTQQVPWPDLSTIQVVGAVGWGQSQLDIPQDLSPEARQLISDCLEPEAKARPDFEKIIVSLRRMRQASPAAGLAPQMQPLASSRGAASAAKEGLPSRKQTTAELTSRAASIETRRTL